jgi:hypothetical protein
MKKYIGTKEVKAQPMTAKEAIEKGYKVNNHTGDGYEVEYKDGYKSWSPKEVFEESYKLVDTFKGKAMPKEEFNIVVQVMGLLRSGKISAMTPNCEVRELILAEKAKEDKQ